MDVTRFSGCWLFGILDNHASIGREPFQKITYSEYNAHLVLATLVLYSDRMADHDVAEGGDGDLIHRCYNDNDTNTHDNNRHKTIPSDHHVEQDCVDQAQAR